MGTFGQVAHSSCFHTIASVVVFLLWGLASVAAQPTSNVDRCKSIDVWGTSVSLDEAVAACTAIIGSGREGDKNLADIHTLRGTALSRKNELDRALMDFDQAIRLDPTFAKAHNARGLIHMRKGKIDDALADFNEALRLDPNYALAYAHRGWTYNLKRDFERALADFDQAIKRDPKAVSFYNDRGRMWRNKGEVERAIADFNTAIRLDPKAAYAFYNRGHAWRAKGDIPRAMSDFEAVIKANPAYVAAYTSRGLAYEAKGERDRARADFNTALSWPQKYDNGKWAHDTARARLALLEEAPRKRQAKASATARIALVIGNGFYKNVPALANPVNDAEAVAKALREIGFDVLEGTNLDRKRQEQQVSVFLRKASTAHVALLFYAGHGMQIDGQNYLIPVDSKLSAPTDLLYEALELAKILNGLDDEARANIVILDACRDNPLAEAGKKGSGGSSGLAAVSTVGYGTLIAYATAPDNVALDGKGVNSPFTTALLKHIRTPGLEVRQMLTQVRAEVIKSTEKKLVPWDNSSLLGDVYLAGRTPSATR